MSERMPDGMSEYMPDTMSEYMSDRMPDRMSQYLSDRMPDSMPEHMSDRMPEYMPDRMSECMSDILSEYKDYMSKYTSCNVLVWITRRKVIFLKWRETRFQDSDLPGKSRRSIEAASADSPSSAFE